MSKSTERSEFLRLLNKYLQQQASPEEIRFLQCYYKYFDQSEKASVQLSDDQRKLLEDRMFQKITQRINPDRLSKARIYSIDPRRKWAAAAIVFLFISTAAYFIIHRGSVPSVAVAANSQLISKNDLSPGSDKAILTLADGSSIVLDSAHKGKIGSQGNTRILKLRGGELVYERQPAPVTDEAIRFNMITTQRGGQYQVRLSDGSKVWLNAASSLRYPAAFQGDRSVELTGEAYFEIASQYRTTANGKSEKIPFTVMANGARIEVLGTHFNINAYSDEPSTKTTLLEGAVNIRAGTTSVSMKPGEETMVENTGAIKRSTAVHVEDAIAWKNGLFQFRSADIQTIMRQVSRWYDVDVAFEKNIPEKFYAELPRNTSASALFKILETTGAVHFVIDGRKVKVLP